MDLSAYDITGRNYYFVRTEKGDFFDSFIEKGFVGLLWNEITKPMLRNLDVKNADLRSFIEKYHTEQLADQGEAARKITISTIINKLITFRDMKKGDIVLIPSSGNHSIAFGEIIDDEVYSVVDSNPCQKRRKVKWVNQELFRRLDAKFAYITKSYHAISEIDQKYADVINAYMFSSYIDETHAAINIKIGKEDPIHYNDVRTLIDNIITIAKQYDLKHGIEENYEELEILINLQSPGFLTLKNLKNTGKGLVFALGLINLGCTSERSEQQEAQYQEAITEHDIDQNNFQETLGTLDSLSYQQ